MKLLVTVILTLLPLLDAQTCSNCASSWSGTKSVCESIKLSPHESLHINDSCPELTINDATGSIGAKTFSLVPQIKEITINNSEIYNIEDGALCSLPIVEKISLHRDSNRQFPILTESLFSNCDKIRSLTLENLLMEPNALKNLVNLEELHLVRQDITRLNSDYLQSLSNLKKLEFRECKIKTIDAGAICLSPKLVELQLVSNTLPALTKSMFENCNSVERLRYVEITAETADNALDSKEQTLGANIFSGFVKIEEVAFEHLSIRHLTKHQLSGLNNAKNLMIAYSKLTTIDRDVFENFNNLEMLYLSDNEISKFDKDVIYSLPKLENLFLSNNKLTSIDNISHPHLKSLLVTRNKISKINATAVKENFPELETLSICYNEIKGDPLYSVEEEFEETLGNKFDLNSRSCLF